MNPYTQAIILSASTLRMLPHIALYLLHKKQIDADLEKYSNGERGVRAFIKVATRQRVFRNLFYYRLGEYVSVFIQWLLPPERSLHIWCPSIGEGCHFEHNYSTYLNAERIGRKFYCLSPWATTRKGVVPSLAMTCLFIREQRSLAASPLVTMW